MQLQGVADAFDDLGDGTDVLAVAGFTAAAGS